VHPYTDIAYRSGLSFSDPTDANEFHPGTIQGYERIGANAQFNCQPKTGCEPLIGGLPTVYPHAGLLNTLAYLARRPSTATNRNRARARWTYYFFLDVDIEKLASRPIDADALADTDNPTLNNPNCAVCHQVHDPVAGTYQDYGDEGFYKDKFLGMDSLPRSYKNPEDGSDTGYQPGDTWYADMRDPGFEGTMAPAGQDSLQWVAQQIVADPRFATATVKFWWPAVFGVDPLEAPENPADVDFPVQQAAFDAQENFVAQLSDGLRKGFNGGAVFNLKDLLIAMVTSDWYRATSANSLDADQKTELDIASVGSEQVLTPEQLDNKLKATTGYAWSLFVGGRLNRSFDLLTDVYNLYYGGIDSDGVEQRARALTPLMTKVVTTMGIESACPIVAGEFNRADAQRLLFKGLTRYLTPQTESVSSYSVNSQQTLQLNADAGGGNEKISIASDNGITGNAGVLIGNIRVDDAQGMQLALFDPAQLTSIPGASASCGSAQTDGWRLNNNCILEIPLSLASAQALTVNVTATPINSEQASLAVSLAVTDTQPLNTTGAVAIRTALAAMHQRLLDETLQLSDTELAASYQLFLDLWNARRNANKSTYLANTCNYTFSDAQKEASDPYQVMNAWMGVMTYFLTDYRFIHE